MDTQTTINETIEIIKKIKFGDTELVISNINPYRYEYGKGKEVLRIEILDSNASFDDIKKLDGNEDPIYYYENDTLKLPYEGYVYDFSCQYSEGKYSIELKRMDKTERLVQKLSEKVGVEDVIIDNLNLEETKTYQIGFIQKQCSETIYKGIDVETSLGVEHFSLDETDQSNIFALYDMQSSSGDSVIYHADGKECRVFTSEEFNDIAIAARNYITKCTTKYNYLKQWVQRSQYKMEVLSIEFTSELPDDLQTGYNAVIQSISES